jgi:hypothetical protein
MLTRDLIQHYAPDEEKEVRQAMKKFYANMVRPQVPIKI